MIAEMEATLPTDGQITPQLMKQGPPFDHRVPTDRAEQQVSATGFRDVQICPGFHFHYAITARKS